MTNLTRMVAVCAAWMTFCQAGAVQDAPDFDARAWRVFSRTTDLMGSGEVGDLERVVSDMTDFLGRRNLTSDERSYALEYRARASGILEPLSFEAPVRDLRAALAAGPMAEKREADIRHLLISLLLNAGQMGDAVTEFEQHRESLGGHFPRLAAKMIDAYVAERRLPDGLQVLKDAADMSSQYKAELEAKRFAILLQMRDFSGAEAALADHAEAAFPDAPYIVAAQTAVAKSKSDEPAVAELRAIATTFLGSEVRWREENTDAKPLLRVSPTGFERCLRTLATASRLNKDGPRVVTVAMQFDVSVEGEPIEIEVVSSDDRCFNRYSVEAVEAWKYAPKLIDGVAQRRQGVRTNIKFSIGR